jgi:transposase
MRYFIGIDVHRHFIQVSVVDATGKEIFNGRLDLHDVSEIRAFLAAFPPEQTEVVMEATFGWMWLTDLLQGMGYPVHLAHSRSVRLIAESRLHTDKVNARDLANLLRTNWLPEAYLAPPAVRDLRMLLRHREALVKARTMEKNRVHALLVRYNLHVEATDIFGAKGMAALRALVLPEPAPGILRDILFHVRFLNGQIRRAERGLDRRLAPDERVEWLSTLPGVGRLTAYFLVAEIGTIERFVSPEKLASYCGLCPSTHQSAAHVHHGSTAGSGRRLLKWSLVEASHTAVRRDSYFAKSFHQVSKKRGKGTGNGRAYVAVARKMAMIIWHLLKEQRPYEVRLSPSQVGSAVAMRESA